MPAATTSMTSPSQVSDGLGGSDVQTLAVTVTNANEAPVIVSNGGGATASVSVAENGTAVTTVSASDPDAGAVLTYAIVGGADQSKFTIDASGVLTFVAAPDFEAPGDVGGDNVYDVAVQVSDGARRHRRPDARRHGDQRQRGAGDRPNGGGATAAVERRRERHGGDDGVGERSRRRGGAELFRWSAAPISPSSPSTPRVSSPSWRRRTSRRRAMSAATTSMTSPSRSPTGSAASTSRRLPSR